MLLCTPPRQNAQNAQHSKPCVLKMSTTRRRNANNHSTRLLRKPRFASAVVFLAQNACPLVEASCVLLDPRFPARRTDTSSFFLSLRSRGLLAERRMYFLEQASQPDAHLPLTTVSYACDTQQANCEPKSLLPRTSFPARRTPTSRVERAGGSESVHPTPTRVHALLPRSLAPVGAPPSHRREERRGREHRLPATCVQMCLHGAGERLSVGASMVAL